MNDHESEHYIAPESRLPCSLCGGSDHTARWHYPPGFFRRVANQLRLQRCTCRAVGCDECDNDH